MTDLQVEKFSSSTSYAHFDVKMPMRVYSAFKDLLKYGLSVRFCW